MPSGTPSTSSASRFVIAIPINRHQNVELVNSKIIRNKQIHLRILSHNLLFHPICPIDYTDVKVVVSLRCSQVM
jgi:hypothetical protein